MKSWWKSKTVWTGAATVLATVGAYVAGEISVSAALQTGATALIGIFLRLGMLEASGTGQ